MISIPEKGTVTKATVFDPRLLVLFGATKVGKTTQVVELQDWLRKEHPEKSAIILDTEGGTDMYDARKLRISSLKDLKEFIVQAKKNKEDFIVLDTLDVVVEWIEKLVCETNDVESIGDLAFGKGYGLVREKTMNVINHLKDCCEHLILVGHRKKTIIGNETVEVNVSSLDLPGKLKNVICADADAIGYMYRLDDQLKVSFKATEDLEAGSRIPHLIDTIDFDWSKMFINLN